MIEENKSNKCEWRWNLSPFWSGVNTMKSDHLTTADCAYQQGRHSSFCEMRRLILLPWRSGQPTIEYFSQWVFNRCPSAKILIYCLFSFQTLLRCWGWELSQFLKYVLIPWKWVCNHCQDCTVIFIVHLILNWVKYWCCYTQITSSVPNLWISFLICVSLCPDK